MAKKKPAQPEKIDLDVLHTKLTDADIEYLLKLRLTMRKQRMGWALVNRMEEALVDGVDVVHEGEVTCQKRATPGELFRIRQALDAFNPADINSAFKNDNKTIADGLSDDPHTDLESLRQLATEDQRVDRPGAAHPPSVKPAPPSRPSKRS